MDRYLRRQLRRPLRWAAQRLGPRGAVLMYHGIGEVDMDPWGLFVTPQHFDDHLRVLGAMTHPMALHSLVEATDAGCLQPRSVAVTFDDGYANVAELAEPILAANGISATLFVISQPLEAPAEYWWDELAGLVLTPGPLPSRLRLDGPAGPIDVATGEAASYGRDQWRSDLAYRDGEGEPGPRMALYRTLWDHLSRMDHEARQAALGRVAAATGRLRTVRATHRSLTMDELVALDGETVEIGGHTRTHPLLPGLPPEEVRREIVDGKRCLETVLGREVTAFSYPFGANDATAVGAARTAGYRLAVATRPESVTGGTDRFRIGRFDVKDWPGDEFEHRLRRWLRYR